MKVAHYVSYIHVTIMNECGYNALKSIFAVTPFLISLQQFLLLQLHCFQYLFCEVMTVPVLISDACVSINK